MVFEDREYIYIYYIIYAYNDHHWPQVNHPKLGTFQSQTGMGLLQEHGVVVLPHLRPLSGNCKQCPASNAC